MHYRIALVCTIATGVLACSDASFGPQDTVAAHVAGRVVTSSGVAVTSAPVFFHVSRPLVAGVCDATDEVTGVLRLPVETGSNGVFGWTLKLAGRDLPGTSCVTVVAEPAGRLDLRADSVPRVPIEFRHESELLDSIFVRIELPIR